MLFVLPYIYVYTTKSKTKYRVILQYSGLIKFNFRIVFIGEWGYLEGYQNQQGNLFSITLVINKPGALSMCQYFTEEFAGE